MKFPSFAFCLFVHLVKALLFLVAWFMVPLGMWLGKIRQGELRAGQWGGYAWDMNGVGVTGVRVPTIVTEGLWKIFGLPDEPGIGLYEKTVSKIYNAKGWWWTVYYQLAFRNVGHGWLGMFKQSRLAGAECEPPVYKKLGPFYYGLKRYEDWNRYDASWTLQENMTYGMYNFPDKTTAYYYVPDFGIGQPN